MPIPTATDGHPIEFVKALRSRFGSRLVLSFSRYRYRRRSRADNRESFTAPITAVNRSWLADQLTSLAPDQELALESRVRVGRELRHIPMIDFIGMAHGQLTEVMDVLPQYSSKGVQVYHSGRSFHAYFPLLITAHEWVQFMASALLCNTPSRPRVVDQRWVAHRLIGGYGALRWSCNTSFYKGMPKRVPASRLA